MSREQLELIEQKHATQLDLILHQYRNDSATLYHKIREYLVQVAPELAAEIYAKWN